MAKRTFGWLQNPGDLSKLKQVVGIFDFGSNTNKWIREKRLPLLKKYNLISDDDFNKFIDILSRDTIVVKYSLLKGKGAGNLGRSNAICSGIVQAVIDAQQDRAYTDIDGNLITIKKPYTDDWTAEGYIRWAISCGLLNYDNENDSCSISDLGKELSNTADDSLEEKETLAKALLSYPPVCRILTLLSDGNGYTKFELGRKLGFFGELGFTSIPQNIYAYDYNMATSSEKSKVRSNEEGDSDKYARGIASWCIQMGWVKSETVLIKEYYRGQGFDISLKKYYITREGEKALTRANGNSSNKKIAKIVHYEMLASNKAPDAAYLRYERACVINSILNSDKSLEQIKDILKGNGFDVSEDAVKDDILGLEAIGINVRERNGKYKITDSIIGLKIPDKTSACKADITELKDKIRKSLKVLDHKYLVLVDLAYSDASTKSKKNSDAREFEIQTADLFTKELKFDGMRLGDSNRPDVIISHDNFGTIIDNKSYKDGFNIDKKCADEMSRYINENQRRIPELPKNEWWKNFDVNVDIFTFLFITSYLKGNFKDQLEYISKSQSDIKGAAISVEHLLYISEKVKNGSMDKADFFKLFNNDEIRVTV